MNWTSNNQQPQQPQVSFAGVTPSQDGRAMQPGHHVVNGKRLVASQTHYGPAIFFEVEVVESTSMTPGPASLKFKLDGDMERSGKGRVMALIIELGKMKGLAIDPNNWNDQYWRWASCTGEYAGQPSPLEGTTWEIQSTQEIAQKSGRPFTKSQAYPMQPGERKGLQLQQQPQQPPPQQPAQGYSNASSGTATQNLPGSSFAPAPGMQPPQPTAPPTQQPAQPPMPGTPAQQPMPQHVLPQQPGPLPSSPAQQPITPQSPMPGQFVQPMPGQPMPPQPGFAQPQPGYVSPAPQMPAPAQPPVPGLPVPGKPVG